MKRSAALTLLSEDHHHALVIASVLNRATAATARSSAMLFADFITEHEAQHFALEESILLPELPAGECEQELAERVRTDHSYLLDAARELSVHPGPSVASLTRVGSRLRAHVQLEERELFPYLEASLDPASLERIGAELRAARSAHPTVPSEGECRAQQRVSNSDRGVDNAADGGSARNP